MSQARILVVEDEPAIQELVTINLKHAGFLVVRAGSAEEAESAIRAGMPKIPVELLSGDFNLHGIRRSLIQMQSRPNSLASNRQSNEHNSSDGNQQDFNARVAFVVTGAFVAFGEIGRAHV